MIPVRPAYLEERLVRPANPAHNQLVPRVGEVVEVVPPDDPRSQSKLVFEYVVEVQYVDEWGAAASRCYPHCTVMSAFGSRADFSTWTPRVSTRRDAAGYGDGAKVLLLCPNGEASAAVIIGGVRDQSDPGDAPPRAAFGTRFWYARWNGVVCQINEAGEVAFLHRGPSDSEGRTLEGQGAESGWVLSRDGSVRVHAASAEVKLDQPDKVVRISAASGVRIGEATDHLLRGETYRNNQAQYHQLLDGLLKQVVELLATMGTAFKATSVLFVLPIIGPILAAPAMGQVGVSMDALAVLVEAAKKALAAFEENAASYLSEKNLSD